MKTFKIQPQDDGVRLNRFLARVAPGLPGGLMHKYLRERRIKRNGSRCEASTRLCAGDELALYIDDAFFAAPNVRPDFMRAGRELKIIYEDHNLAILAKPAGLLSHGADDSGRTGNSRTGDTLVDRFKRYLFDKGEYRPGDGAAFAPVICNRLDRGTEGMVVAAKNAEEARVMNQMIKEGRLQKSYLCAVAGPPPADGRYTAYLTKDERANTVSVRKNQTESAKKIATAIRTVAQKGELSLLEIGLLTGRSHQIRAHLAFLGCPVLGDAKYGDPKINRRYGLKTQALCAYRLRFCPDPIADAPLYYLDGQSFTLDEVWFAKKYFGVDCFDR